MSGTEQLNMLDEGFFTEEGRLIGGKCASCGKYSYPKVSRCQNCSSSDVSEVLLSEEGELYSYTVVRVGPRWWKDKVPYEIGRIKLPEGIIVTSHLRHDPDGGELKIGTKMRSEPGEMVNGEGERVKIFRFYPVNGGNSNA